jgi:hypothetical protein
MKSVARVVQMRTLQNEPLHKLHNPRVAPAVLKPQVLYKIAGLTTSGNGMAAGRSADSLLCWWLELERRSQARSTQSTHMSMSKLASIGCATFQVSLFICCTCVHQAYLHTAPSFGYSSIVRRTQKPFANGQFSLLTTSSAVKRSNRLQTAIVLH